MYKCDKCGKEFSSKKLLDIHKEKLCHAIFKKGKVTRYYTQKSPRLVSGFIKLAKAGDEEALEWIIEHYTPFISRFADNWIESRGLESFEKEDLMQIGYIALLKCLKSEENFTTRIFFYLLAEFNENYAYSGRIIKVPRHIYENFNNPENKDILNNTEVILANNIDGAFSYNYDMYFDYTDVIAAMEKACSKKEMTVLYYRFIKNETLDQVGSRFGLTRERIRQIENKAIRKTRLHYFHPNLKREECTINDISMDNVDLKEPDVSRKTNVSKKKCYYNTSSRRKPTLEQLKEACRTFPNDYDHMWFNKSPHKDHRDNAIGYYRANEKCCFDLYIKKDGVVNVIYRSFKEEDVLNMILNTLRNEYINKL